MATTGDKALLLLLLHVQGGVVTAAAVGAPNAPQEGRTAAAAITRDMTATFNLGDVLLLQLWLR